LRLSSNREELRFPSGSHRGAGPRENEMQSSDETSARNTARKSFIFRPSVLRMALLSLYIVFLSSRSCCSVESSKSRVFRRRVPSLWGFENETAFRIRWLAGCAMCGRSRARASSQTQGLQPYHRAERHTYNYLDTKINWRELKAYFLLRVLLTITIHIQSCRRTLSLRLDWMRELTPFTNQVSAHQQHLLIRFKFLTTSTH
jgi:hypothetical protein